MPSEKFEFSGHDGSALAARLDLPEGPHRATALFAHCFTCSKDISAARRISERLNAHGFAVLRFDFTGLGHSGGEFANTHFSSNIADIDLAVAALAARGMAPALMVGHSLGGAAVLRAAARHASVRAVATIGAPYDPAHVTHNFGGKLDDIRDKGEAVVDLAGRPFTIRRAFLEDIEAAELAPAIRSLDRALLILHAPRDETVGIDNAAEIFAAAKHPKSFITLDDADHLLSAAADSAYAADVISAWAARYIPETAENRAEVPPGVIRTSEADASGFMQQITDAAGHHALADEPVSLGGTDKGMTPFGFLSAALGACTAITLRMYARRKGIALDHVSVDIRHEKLTAVARGQAADRFHRLIRLEGDLDDATRARLLEIAGKCPVHRTLTRGALVEDELAAPLVGAA